MKTKKLEPRIIPFKHRVAYNGKNGKMVWKTHDHFKVLFGRKSAGVFWSESQAERWIATFGSQEAIDRYFKICIEVANRNLKIARREVAATRKNWSDTHLRLAWLQGKLKYKP